MTDPLQALESLVGKMHEAGSKGDAVVGRAWLTKYADELEPIIRQLKERMAELEGLWHRAQEIAIENHDDLTAAESRLDDCDDQAVEMVKLREQVESLRAIIQSHDGPGYETEMAKLRAQTEALFKFNDELRAERERTQSVDPTVVLDRWWNDAVFHAQATMVMWESRERWKDAAHSWAAWAMSLDPEVRADVEYAATHLDEVVESARPAAEVLAPYLQASSPKDDDDVGESGGPKEADTTDPLRKSRAPGLNLGLESPPLSPSNSVAKDSDIPEKEDNDA